MFLRSPDCFPVKKMSNKEIYIKKQWLGFAFNYLSFGNQAGTMQRMHQMKRRIAGLFNQNSQSFSNDLYIQYACR
jgi:hypothetical protein